VWINPLSPLLSPPSQGTERDMSSVVGPPEASVASPARESPVNPALSESPANPTATESPANPVKACEGEEVVAFTRAPGARLWIDVDSSERRFAVLLHGFERKEVRR
jgi:hypothetical protein